MLNNPVIRKSNKPEICKSNKPVIHKPNNPEFHKPNNPVIRKSNNQVFRKHYNILKDIFVIHLILESFIYNADSRSTNPLQKYKQLSVNCPSIVSVNYVRQLCPSIVSVN